MKKNRRILAMLVLIAMLAAALGAGAEATLTGRAHRPTPSPSTGSSWVNTPDPDAQDSQSPEAGATGAPGLETAGAETPVPDDSAFEPGEETPVPEGEIFLPGEGTSMPDGTESPAPEESGEASPEPVEATPDAETTPEAETTLEVEATPEAEATSDAAGDAQGGVTSPVDDSTTLPDGSYAPEEFHFSGGTGKTKISCARVVVSGGRARAAIAFSSVNYTLVKASGQRFEAQAEGGGSSFTIPVALNQDNRILATTTAMGASHEIEYIIHITLTGTGDPGDEPDEYEDGDYGIDIESDYKMFRIASSSAKVSQGKVVVTICTDSVSYDRIYIGAKEDLDRSGFVQGALNDAGTGYSFTFELPKSCMGRSIDFVPGKPDGTWYEKKQYHLIIPEALGDKLGGADEPEVPDLEDGEYGVEVESSASMFKVVKAVLTAKGGSYTAVITLSGTGYDKLYMGTAAEAETADAGTYIGCTADAEGKYAFAIPVPALDAPVDVAAHSVKNDKWYDRQLTFKSDTLRKPEAPDLEDGEYGVEVESSASMFKVVKAVLTAKGGSYTAVITLSGTGYDKLYMGTAAEAETADAGTYIGCTADAEGKYTFAIPVPALDAPVDVAAHSVKNDKWYDRQLTFKSDTLQQVGGAEETAAPSPSPSPSPAPAETPEADLNGSTSRVDSSTALADGVYAPDRFSYSGGTGKVTLSCPRVTVSGGRAKATIVFSSPSFSYVKANGQKIYGSHGGSSSSFEIPVKLNANNRIIGMTTAMSQDHEVEYTIYVYLAAAEEGGGASADAPAVPGLTYLSKDEFDAAEFFAIYRYAGGSTVIEVEGAGRYLIAGEGTELPAGIEEELTVLPRPVEAAYAADEAIYDRIACIGDPDALSAVKLAGFEGGAPGFAGSCEAPDYAALLKAGCDLAVMPREFAEAEAHSDVVERLGLLGIPVFVDRSLDEASDAARLEWIKAYGVIFDCEEEARAAYAAMAAAQAA